MNKKILVIDTDMGQVILLKRCLSMFRYSIDFVYNSLTTDEKVASNHYDLIVLDPHMHDGEGFKIMKSLKKSGDTSTIPILISTTIHTTDSVNRSLFYGASDYLIKPFKVGLLIEKICNLINMVVEQKWEKLPKNQRQALQDSMSGVSAAFHASKKHDSEMVDVSRLNNAARELVTVINSGKIRILLDALKEHDGYSYVHSIRTSVFLVKFAGGMGIRSEKDIEDMALAGLVHDIGKASIPITILNKPFKLTKKEFAIIQSHVINSVEILDSCSGVGEVVMDVAWGHHEKLDGTGYPRGMVEQGMGDITKMASIVDIFTALNDERPYKPSYAPKKCLDIMYGMEGKLDMKLLECFENSVVEAVY